MKFKFATSLFAILLMLAVGFTATANNGDPGKDKKTEPAKIEAANQIISIVQIEAIPEFNLNAEVMTVSILPACGDDVYVTGTASTSAPSGYTLDHVSYDSFGYTKEYSRSCTETISCGICPPP